MANFTPEQINRTMDYTSRIIQFSWTGSALLLTAQGWLVNKMYSNNRSFKPWHAVALISCLANILALICLLYWYKMVVEEVLKEKIDFFSSGILCWREKYFDFTLASITFFAVGFFLWTWLKSNNKKDT